MSWKKIGLSLLLVDFVGYTAYALYQHGYLGLIQAATANAATMQVSIDLVIALSFVTIWRRSIVPAVIALRERAMRRGVHLPTSQAA